MTTATTTLALDRVAAPPTLRARDWAGDDRLYVRAGFISDKYRLAHVQDFDHAETFEQVGEDGGAFTVRNLKATPEMVGDYAPDMEGLVARVLENDLQPATAELFDGARIIVQNTRNGRDMYVMRTATGEAFGLDREYLDQFTAEADAMAPAEPPAFFGHRSRWVTWQVFAVGGDKSTVVRRVAYSAAHHVEKGRQLYESGRWEGLLMPVRLA